MQKSPKILVFGANGQVGRALNICLDNAVFLGRSEADLSRPETLPAIARSIIPDVIINAAAYTAVDKAQSERELAFRVNHKAPEILARTAADLDIPYIHYSSDYIFNGSGSKAWEEDDTPAPVNIYGESKLAGDEAVVKINGKYLIICTSWIYDAHGKNFLNTMLKLGSEREHLKIVADQYGAPTYAGHLAQASKTALEVAMAKENFPSGMYNICGSGETNWYGFAQEIFTQARKSGMELKLKNLEAITTQEYNAPAQRPLNSRLNCAKASRVFNITMPQWQVGIHEIMKEKMI